MTQPDNHYTSIDPCSDPRMVIRRFHIMTGRTFVAGQNKAGDAIAAAQIIREADRVSVYVIDTHAEPGQPRIINVPKAPPELRRRLP